jgi:hypothetical protein
MLTPQTKSKQSGQAIIEFLPSVLLFLIVVGGGLSYFQMMREVTIRQEVVRNLAFAKIQNSGTLTTPLTQSTSEVLVSGLPEPGVAIPANRFDFINREDPCFVVTPDQVTQSVSGLNIFGLGQIQPFTISTFAVVYRRPAGSCL